MPGVPYVGEAVQITRYRCLANARAPGDEQRQPAHVIGFPHQGVFEVHQGRDRAFFNRGATYRTGHPCGGGDHGSAIAVRQCFHENVLAKRVAEPVSLESIGWAVGVSPFHLCRVFRALTGTSVSRYRHRLRLRAALESVADAHADLSAVAFEHGYSSHP